MEIETLSSPAVADFLHANPVFAGVPLREELEALCLGASKVQAHIDGRDVVKVVVVPERLVNVVVR